MDSSLSREGLAHCPDVSAETALCHAPHPPAAADTGSSSSRRLKTSQTSPNLHTNHLSEPETFQRHKIQLEKQISKEITS